MSHRLVLMGASGPFVGPWIYPIGAEDYIEQKGESGCAVIDYRVKDSPESFTQILGQRIPFPLNVTKYRICLSSGQTSPTTVRVYLT